MQTVSMKLGWSLALTCFLIAGLAGFAGWSNLSDARALAARGLTVTATVTELRHRQRRSPSDPIASAGSIHDWFVTVRYPTGSATDNSLTLRTVRESVSETFFATLAEGDRIPVTYLPDQPDTAQIEPGGTGWNGIWALLTGAGFVGLGLGVLWLFRRARARAAPGPEVL